MSSVSVIIPTYNRASWLEETVASILGQTRPPLEILIVDDGSTDHTPTVCAGFPPPVRYLRQPNSGVSAARNHGLREAKGEWIAFADSDDPWEARKLEVQLKVLESLPQAQWCITGSTVIDVEGRPLPGVQSWGRVFSAFGGRTDPDQYFASWLTGAEITVGAEDFQVWWGDAFGMLFLGNVVLPSSVLIRKDLADRLGGFDERFRLAEETEFFHRVAAEAPVAIVTAPLTRYRVGQGASLISSANIVRLIENALISGDRAARLRSPLPAAASAARVAGRRQLLSRLAYAKLTALDVTGSRHAVRQAWAEGAPRSTRWLTIYLATLLPAFVLRSLRALKSRLRGR